MEYYDLNSNQQKQQEEEHNKRELYKIKSVSDNWHNSKDISLYINNVLINFNAACYYDLLNKKVCISNLRLLDNDFIQELKDNFKEEIIDFNQNKFVFEYRLNYFSKLLNKQINHYVQFIPNYAFDNIVDSDYLIGFKTDFFIHIFRKEIFIDILLFLYENVEFIIKYISDDKTSYDYNEELEEYKIKTLSEKRRMKSILENF